jgi:hypothetical protein
MEDGYIKYTTDWVQEPIKLDQRIIEEIDFWRRKCYEKSWIGMYPNGIGFGNISMRLDESRFLISASATGNLQTTNSSHYAIVEDFDLQKNWLKCRGEQTASSESLSHAALYGVDVQRIVHIHDYNLWTKWKGKMPTTDINVEYGTPQMAIELMRCQNQIKEDFGVIVMGGHQEGIIAYGKSFKQIFDLILSL